MSNFISLFVEKKGELLELFIQHMNMTTMAVFISLIIGVPIGIRISAVAAVGTMTIAAFAGAGGLGWYINLGLNSRNTMLVLLGAIPASLLALLMDFLLGKLEHAVTSEGLLAPEQIQNIPKAKRRKERGIVTVLCAALVLVPVGSSVYENFQKQNQKTVVVGTSNFTEALILGYMYAELIENDTDIEVEQRFNLNGASVCYDALESDKINMFVEYTGTIMANMLKEAVETKDAEKLYQQVSTKMDQEHQIYISEPLGYNPVFDSCKVTKRLQTQ